MARKSKDLVSYVDGVKFTQCAYRGPKKGQETFPLDKSRYTVWAQTVSKFTRGTRGVLGTVDRV
jgi:hypothetical protein